MTDILNMNEVATYASKLNKRTNKGEAFAIIQGLITSDLYKDLDKENIAKLYQFFTPSIPAKPKTLYQWINKAKAKNELRAFLNYIYVCKAGNVVATDGHRLHLAPNTDNLDVGFYDSNMNKISLDLNFPEYQRLIPDPDGRTKIENFDLDAAPLQFSAMAADKGKANELVILTNKEQQKIGVQKLYLIDCLSGMDNPVIYAGEPDEPILLKDEQGRLALLMPMRLA